MNKEGGGGKVATSDGDISDSIVCVSDWDPLPADNPTLKCQLTTQHDITALSCTPTYLSLQFLHVSI